MVLIFFAPKTEDAVKAEKGMLHGRREGSYGHFGVFACMCKCLLFSFLDCDGEKG